MTESNDLSEMERKTLEMRKALLDRQQAILAENAQNAGRLQSKFLSGRQAALEQTADLFHLQAEAAGGMPAPDLPAIDPRKPLLYTHDQLVEFGRGDHAKALGAEYAVYQGRRAPRIPNGDLLLMSRVLSATGRRLHPQAGDEILVEYDVPEDAWYFQDNSSPSIPYSILMEIALQPCGMLAAHLGASLQFAEQEYYFRNLDGEARILKQLDLRGKTITTRARLHQPMVSGKQIIHKFDFQLTADGEAIFEGNSVFGFFSPEAMANQLGRDGGQETLPLFEQPSPGGLIGKSLILANSAYNQAEIGRPFYRLPGGHFNLLKEVFVSPEGGRSQQGYIYANKPIDPQDWFYTCHFFQDPVMPGSLGVEAILEAMQVFALQQDLGRGFANPRFDLVPRQTMTWKYRGQILQATKMMKLEVHLTRLERSAHQVLLLGDASLWADRIRIYELKDAGIRLVEG